MTGDERREQILQTAVNLFSQRGFKGTTTKEIASAAGVSEAMVFRHFENKDDLYGAILDTKGCQDGVRRFPWEENETLQKAIDEKDDYRGLLQHRPRCAEQAPEGRCLYAAALLLGARGA